MRMQSLVMKSSVQTNIGKTYRKCRETSKKQIKRGKRTEYEQRQKIEQKYKKETNKTGGQQTQNNNNRNNMTTYREKQGKQNGQISE